MSLEALDLPARLRNVLIEAGLDTIGKLAAKGEPEMLEIKSLGQKSLDQLLEQLARVEQLVPQPEPAAEPVAVVEEVEPTIEEPAAEAVPAEVAEIHDAEAAEARVEEIPAEDLPALETEPSPKSWSRSLSRSRDAGRAAATPNRCPLPPTRRLSRTCRTLSGRFPVATHPTRARSDSRRISPS